MNQQEEIIGRLKGKVHDIISSYEKTRLENEILTQEIRSLNEIIKAKQREIINFEKKINTLKIAKSVVITAEDKHEAKLKVNRIVREIDKCIALLNK